MTTFIWILFAIQVHGDHYHALEIRSFKSQIECEMVIEQTGKLPKNIGVGCIRVELPAT